MRRQLDFMKERAGSVEVEAMLSRTAPIFNGDIRSHERVKETPISRFSNRLARLLSYYLVVAGFFANLARNLLI